jgi:hypothetical protein
MTQEESKQETLEEAAEIHLSNLCYHDKKNPDYIPYNEDDLTEMPKDCYCDNCFYGRTKLTEQLIMQAERMYNEGEVGELVYNIIGEYGKYYGIMIDGAKLNDLFEQFKKK